MHCHALHLYTTHNTTTPYIPYYLSTTPSPKLHEHAPHVPISVDLGNSHITTAHKIEHQGCGAFLAAPESPDDEGTRDIPHHPCMTYTKRKAFATPPYTKALMPLNTHTQQNPDWHPTMPHKITLMEE